MKACECGNVETWERGNGENGELRIANREKQKKKIASSAVLHSLFAICCSLFLAGCDAPGITMNPQERSELQGRALDLLKRAARDDADLVSANALEALVNVAPREGLPAFRAALNSSSKLVRLAGCRALGDVRDHDSLNDIMRCLRDPDPLLRLVAAYAAYRCGEVGYGKILSDALGDSPDPDIRAEAAYLVGKINDQRARKRLQAIAERDKSNKTCVLAYAGLAMMGDLDAVRRLIGYAQGDTASRALALQCLAELGHEEAREAFRFRMGPIEDYLENRLIAARGLGRLGSKEGYRLAAESISYSHADAQDPYKAIRVRALAAHALGAIRDPRALPLLRKLAEADNDPLVQVAACQAICQILPLGAAPPSKPKPGALSADEERGNFPKPRSANRRP